MNNPKKIYYAILLVDTDELKKITCTNSTDLNEYCQFAGQNPDDNIELFKTDVERGGEVFWTGMAINGTDTVEITDVTYQSGKQLLDLGNITSPKAGQKKCKIKTKGYKKNNWEKYDLHFEIKVPGGATFGPCVIDPFINIYK